MPNPVTELAEQVGAAADELGGDVAVALDRPPQPEFGDYSTNAPMLLARALKRAPRDIAQDLADALATQLGTDLDHAEVAGPGFVNVHLADAWFARTTAAIAAAGDDYGRGTASGRVNIEFVSANPTGPITVAAARHAAYGDSLARVLEKAGQDVDREYYVNDAGTQVQRFAESIAARARGEEPPEEGYQGEYVKDIAARIDGAATMPTDELGRAGIELMLEGIEATLVRFGVHMDRFARETVTYEEGLVERALEALGEHLYERDGALWLRTTSFGDDKDRVLRRSTGELTYFAADIPYHGTKRERGYDRAITVVGADHHGYVSRVTAAWEALGGDREAFEMIIMQLVNLLESGVKAQMSKRAGAIVTLDELIDDIGVDATRWFLVQRSHETTIDLDLDLAREQSQDNPVYYAQYAHARIVSILRRAGGDERLAAALGTDLAASGESWHPSERALVKRLAAFPSEVDEAAARRAPHRITTYVTELAQDFSAFYRDCKVVGAADEGGDEDLRLALCEITRRTVASSLGLLGVSAPQEM